MENNDKDIELITKYFDLDLSDIELSELEERIEKDAVFAQKIRDYKKSIDIVNTNYKTQKEEDRLKKWRSITDKKSNQTDKKTSWKLIGGIAASFIVLIMGWNIVTRSLQPNIKELAQKSWDKNVGLGYYVDRGNNTDSIQSILIAAYTAYTNKNYTSAINSLKEFDNSNANYQDALLIRALSAYRMGNVTTALTTLDTLTKDPTKKITKVAQWYKGLIYLDMKDLTSAKQFLELPNTKNGAIKLKE